ncbi:UNVERIFIED_CONTAM: hypothetical protein HHA_264680 [Hammondia hammondi]|eukprot:XP_008887254.1 hypothetical protein HHA_264680 [Hammondia hammondi]
MCHPCSLSFLFPAAPLLISHVSPASTGRESFCLPSCSSAPLRVTIIAPQFPSVVLSQRKINLGPFHVLSPSFFPVQSGGEIFA